MLKGKINKVIFIFGILFIVLGIFILVSSLFLINNLEFMENKNIVYNIEKNGIQNNIEDKENNIDKITDYKAILSINKINLSAKIYDINSKKNNVNKNIQVISPSDFPDKEKGNLILASHSGNSKVSYFKNLDKLEIGDTANIYYENKKYNYKIINIYKQEKTGKINITRNKNDTILTLITCDKTDKKYQIVFIAKLINIE